MQVLVAVASKHGSTRGIGEMIAAELRSMNIDADVEELSEASTIGAVDAAVIGSAVYLGHWLPEAIAFIRQQEAGLRPIPVWLFSSGPLGEDQPHPPGDPHHLDEMMMTDRARGHRCFSGRLDREQLGLGERLLVKAVHAPTGDFRDWDAIRDWAKEIGQTLLSGGSGTGTRPAA